MARCLVLAAGLAWLTGCGMAPATPPDRSGMRPGPGLLTGERGEFVIPTAR